MRVFAKEPVVPKLVLLDRDGVVNEDVGSPGVTCVRQLQLIPNAATAIGDLKRSGYNVALITNQSCVGKGLLSDFGLVEIHNLLQDMLCDDDSDAILDDIYVCTATKDRNDPRMKPNPGMITEACNDFQISPENSIFIGDTLTDMQAALSGGVPTRVLVETGYGMGLMNGIPAPEPPREIENIENELSAVTPFIYAPNLHSAVQWLTQNHNIGTK